MSQRRLGAGDTHSDACHDDVTAAFGACASSGTVWLTLGVAQAKHELPNNKKKSSRNRQPGLMG